MESVIHKYVAFTWFRGKYSTLLTCTDGDLCITVVRAMAVGCRTPVHSLHFVGHRRDDKIAVLFPRAGRHVSIYTGPCSLGSRIAGRLAVEDDSLSLADRLGGRADGY